MKAESSYLGHKICTFSKMMTTSATKACRKLIISTEKKDNVVVSQERFS
jgi:hypothetical protein